MYKSLFLCRCFARLQRETSRNLLVTRFMEEMSYMFLFTVFHCRSFSPWLPNFLGWVDYLIFLPMVFRWRASRARAPLIIVLSCTHKCLALIYLFLKEKHTINKNQTPNGTSFNFHTMFKVFNLKTTFLDCTLWVKSKITLMQ